MKNYLFVFLLLLPVLSFAQKSVFKDFTIKESLTNKHKIAVLALDSTGNAREDISGIYPFSINGFSKVLNFQDGVATSPELIDNSTFIFIHFKTAETSRNRLFYVYKTDNGLTPIAISGLVFVLIPLLILGIAYVFKKFLVTFVVLIIGFYLFNHNTGLHFSTILDTITSSLIHLIK